MSKKAEITQAVITRNYNEFASMVAWCKDTGRGCPHNGPPESYPIMICIGDGVSGWTQAADKPIIYHTFKDFGDYVRP